MGCDKHSHPTSIKAVCHWVFPCSSFMKLYSCSWKRQIDIITSIWTHWIMDSPPLPDVTVQETCLFLAIIVQMGHNQRDMLQDYWLTLEQYFMALYRNTMKWYRFCHILRFIHCSDNKNEPDKTDKNYDGLSKVRAIMTSSVIHMLNITVGPDI